MSLQNNIYRPQVFNQAVVVVLHRFKVWAKLSYAVMAYGVAMGFAYIGYIRHWFSTNENLNLLYSMLMAWGLLGLILYIFRQILMRLPLYHPEAQKQPVSQVRKPPFPDG